MGLDSHGLTAGWFGAPFRTPPYFGIPSYRTIEISTINPSIIQAILVVKQLVNLGSDRLQLWFGGPTTGRATWRIIRVTLDNPSYHPTTYGIASLNGDWLTPVINNRMILHVQELKMGRVQVVWPCLTYRPIIKVQLFPNICFNYSWYSYIFLHGFIPYVDIPYVVFTYSPSVGWCSQVHFSTTCPVMISTLNLWCSVWYPLSI